MEFKVEKISVMTKDGWREITNEDQLDRELTHDDLMLLSRKFNMTANLRLPQDQRVNYWLQSKIAQAYAREASKKGK
jgi:hypothetical protein